VTGNLKIEKVGEFDCERALHDLAVPRIPAVVVNEIEIAQWMVRDVEADVGADLMRVCVVLDVCVQE
jgi:hypothetical protein